MCVLSERHAVPRSQNSTQLGWPLSLPWCQFIGCSNMAAWRSCKLAATGYNLPHSLPPHPLLGVSHGEGGWALRGPPLDSLRKWSRLAADSWEGMRPSTFQLEKGFSVKRGRPSVNEGLGKDFYRKGNSVKRSGPFSEPPDSEN